VKAKLSKKIKTVDDLLCQDDVQWLIDQLVKERANLMGMVVIKIDQQGIFQTLSTFDGNSTLSMLSRATYMHHFMENMEYMNKLDKKYMNEPDDTEDDNE